MITEIKNENNINEAIAALELTKVLQKQHLTEIFEDRIQSFAPANLIRSAASNVMGNPSLKKGLLLSVGSTGVLWVLKKMLRGSTPGKGLLFLALSGAGTMLVKKVIGKGIGRTIKLSD